MSERFMWKELKKLFVIDHEIATIRKELDSIDAGIRDERQKLPVMKEKADSLSRQTKDFQKKIDLLEIDSKKLKEDDAKKKHLLETSANPKEYSALEKELANLERSLNNITNEELVLLEKKEALQVELNELEEVIATEGERIAQWEANEGSKYTSLNEKLAELEKSWETQNKEVPAELGASYIEIRNRVADPVVPIVAQSCSACFYSLLHQDITALTKKTIIRCRGCYRFLFVPEEKEEANSTEE
ncbi:MAG: hypothetical protein PVJ92_02345 [Candidatus Dependentiae bacterium]|jgi:predicted  nucleic acid-binding Zn-ribbon protein